VTIEWTGPAQRDMRKLDRAVARRLCAALERYAADRTGNVKALVGPFSGLLRLRVADWRVIFRDDHARGVVRVLRVLHRSRAYR